MLFLAGGYLLSFGLPIILRGNFPGKEVETERRCKVTLPFMILGNIMSFPEKYSLSK